MVLRNVGTPPHHYIMSQPQDLQLTTWNRFLLEKLIVARLILYRTWRFITVFTRAHHWYLSWVRCIQSQPPYPISLRSILILSSYLYLGLPNGLFPPGFPTKSLYAFLIPTLECYMPHPSHPPWLDRANSKIPEIRFCLEWVWQTWWSCPRMSECYWSSVATLPLVVLRVSPPLVKVKLFLFLTKHHAMKAYWRSGGIPPRILWPRHSMEVSGHFLRTGRFTPGKNPRCPLDRRLGETQSRFGHGVEEKNSQPPPGIETRSSDCPARGQLLHRLSYCGSSSSLDQH
jgi:hypothetical protein